MRQPLVQNLTLSHVAVHLGLHQKLKLSQKLSATADMPSQSIAADAFEAYVGALWTKDAHQPEVVREWLDALWSPKVFPSLKEIGDARIAARDAKNGKQAHPDKAESKNARADAVTARDIHQPAACEYFLSWTRDHFLTKMARLLVPRIPPSDRGQQEPCG